MAMTPCQERNHQFSDPAASCPIAARQLLKNLGSPIPGVGRFSFVSWVVTYDE